MTVIISLWSLSPRLLVLAAINLSMWSEKWFLSSLGWSWSVEESRNFNLYFCMWVRLIELPRKAVLCQLSLNRLSPLCAAIQSHWRLIGKVNFLFMNIMRLLQNKTVFYPSRTEKYWQRQLTVKLRDPGKSQETISVNLKFSYHNSTKWRFCQDWK